MTPREYFALKMVWAEKEASFHNAHFRAAEDVQYLPEDFINPERRVARKAQAMREKADTMMERSRLELMKKGDDNDVPLMFREIGPVN
jgi:hypothetical protein